MKEILGILGGMGPLASAEFLKTIYELNLADPEQEAPACILYSDPNFPDRTEAIANGSGALFVSRLTEALESLCRLGATRLVVACITSHHFFPQIPPRLRAKVISLVDIAIEEVLKSRRRYLLLCTNGTRISGVFQKHDRWPLVDDYVVTPNDHDQNLIHDIIYQVKVSGMSDAVISSLNRLVHSYRVDAFIAGCTEMHLASKRLMAHEWRSCNCQIIDPLLMLAKNLKGFIDD
jgi:aspartate racemase